LKWLIEQRDRGAFVSVKDYRRNILGDAANKMKFKDKSAVTLEVSALQYFPWVRIMAEQAIANKTLIPGRFIAVRNMKESEADGDLPAIVAALDIIGASFVETLDTKGTDGSNPHLGGPATITGYFGGIGQPKLTSDGFGVNLVTDQPGSLGYRLVLKETVVPPMIRPSETMSLNIHLSNEGFAAMYNPRPVYIVLLREGTRYTVPIKDVDPRRWAPGQEQTINVSFNLPANVLPGTYQLGLWLPDASASLQNSPAYAVRFANTGVWDPDTGINILASNFQISP
jgi:hypothetical protein